MKRIFGILLILILLLGMPVFAQEEIDGKIEYRLAVYNEDGKLFWRSLNVRDFAGGIDKIPLPQLQDSNGKKISKDEKHVEDTASGWAGTTFRAPTGRAILTLSALPDNCPFELSGGSSLQQKVEFSKEESTLYIYLINRAQPTQTVTLNFVSGEGATPIPYQVVEKGHAPDALQVPKREGYVFKGWSLSKDREELFNGQGFNEDTTLYAVWQEVPGTSYVVSFDGDGGSTPDPITVKEGELAQKPQDPERKGEYRYDFQGWFDGEQEFDFNTPITRNITLKARWKLFYEVKLLGKNKQQIGILEIPEGESIPVPQQPEDPDGRKFLGWFVSEEATQAYDFSRPVKRNLILSARWEDEKKTEVTVRYWDEATMTDIDKVEIKVIPATIGDVIKLEDIRKEIPGYQLRSDTAAEFKVDKPETKITLLYQRHSDETKAETESTTETAVESPSQGGGIGKWLIILVPLFMLLAGVISYMVFRKTKEETEYVEDEDDDNDDLDHTQYKGYEPPSRK